ncbi:glucose dehydrogenase [FAD, quinone]-like [Centruroides vittatus]|uniref:glucose dehydrogenase [FAD, quinone]-like n=1 Tax=Centruroides vittatus TaxID=120091 RepID=UPI00350F30B5
MSGPLTTIGAVEIEGFVNSKYNQQHDWPDLMIFWHSSRIDNGLSNANDELQSIFDKFKHKDIITCLPYVTRTKSRGVLTLASNNPHDDPLIDFNIFSHPYDLKVEIEGMKYCLKMASTEPLKKFGVRPLPYIMPGCERYEQFSDEYLACMALVFPFSGHHFAGTCKMGHPNDPTAVVDPTLRVKGVQNLRVVNASVIPSLMAGHTMSPVMMIAEKAADMILNNL